jgi:hypothetical protein
MYLLTALYHLVAHDHEDQAQWQQSYVDIGNPERVAGAQQML